jgi:predicted transglutaminase-like cysteine proteinase
MVRLLTLLLLLAIVALAGSQPNRPFISVEELNELKSKYGDAAKRRGLALNALIEQLRSAGHEHQLKEVNRFFNQIPYATDQKVWRQQDYWATPTEFMGKNRGDCEDYVVSKYFVLRALGFEDKHLFLTYVKSVKVKVAHMVLSYFGEGRKIPLVLDNYNPAIVVANKRQDLVPVYSFNAKSLFLTNSSAGLGRALPSSKLRTNGKWKRLLQEWGGERP